MYVRIATIAAACLLGYWVGSGLTERDYESRLHDQAVAYAQQWQSAVEEASRAAETQRKRDVAQAEARGKRSVAAKEVIHEINIAAPGADWTADERLRLERLYAAHGFNPDGTPAGVPSAVPAAP